jgi:ABC-2 type transport system permease protein
MLAIFKREMKGYFSSAVGYIFLAGFFFATAFVFWMGNLAGNTSDMSTLFNSMQFALVFLMPILTMRLMSEEKKQRTDQLLLTSPISLTGMVFGKFLAALIVFAIGLASTVVYALTLAIYVNVDTFVILGNILGTLLLAAALIGIGLFISSLTENQVVAVFVSFIVLLLLYIVGYASGAITNKILLTLVTSVALFTRYTNFAMGIFNLGDAVYYFSIAAVFIFLTVRMIEKRRWS